MHCIVNTLEEIQSSHPLRTRYCFFLLLMTVSIDDVILVGVDLAEETVDQLLKDPGTQF